MSKFFYCYSMNLKKFLMDNGMRYDLVANNPNNNKLFFRFERNEELCRLIDKWAEGNPCKNK